MEFLTIIVILCLFFVFALNKLLFGVKKTLPYSDIIRKNTALNIFFRGLWLFFDNIRKPRKW